MTENNNQFVILAIVAIVAVVGLVTLLAGNLQKTEYIAVNSAGEAVAKFKAGKALDEVVNSIEDGPDVFENVNNFAGRAMYTIEKLSECAVDCQDTDCHETCKAKAMYSLESTNVQSEENIVGQASKTVSDEKTTIADCKGFWPYC